LIIRYYDYESDSDGECPPTPEPATLESEDYIDGDEAFSPYLRNCPGYADIALEHYNSQKKNEVIFSSLFPIYICTVLLSNQMVC
jgi:hypothetical protein